MVVFTLLSASLCAPALGQPLTFTTLAGPAGGPGGADGFANLARFQNPGDVATDAAGNVYVADIYNHEVRKITPAGEVTTLAGLAGVSGSANGTGSVARFYGPSGIAATAGGTVYVADELNYTIRKITPGGVVTTFAGTRSVQGSTDGPANVALFMRPRGLGLDAAGNLYVTDWSAHTIRKITPAGVVSTLAGLAGSYGTTDDVGSAARFKEPFDIDVDSAGNAYVADSTNCTIRKIAPDGTVSTFAGTAGSCGTSDGTGSAARFVFPYGLTVDDGNVLYVADGVHTIRRINTTNAEVLTFAGFPNLAGDADGNGSAARFNQPTGTAADAAGNVYVADNANDTIRKITPSGDVSTFAGSPATLGKTDGTGNAARFNRPAGVAVDAAGTVYVADFSSHLIRKITPGGVVTTLAGSPTGGGSTDGTGSGARFFGPAAIALGPDGHLYVSDSLNHTIRKVTTPGGVVTTIAGLAGNAGVDNGTGSSARFRYPEGIAVAPDGTIYVADTENHTIRAIDSNGQVSTPAGLAGSSGNANGLGSVARFYYPIGLAVASTGTIYVADRHNFTIRAMTPPVNNQSDVSTYAGTAGGYGSADGTGAAAQFYYPTGVAVDSASVLWVADRQNHLIRKIAPGAVVTTVGGVPGKVGSSEGRGSAALFNFPTGIAVRAGGGGIYVADERNNKIRFGRPGLEGDATISDPMGDVGAPSQLGSTPTTASIFQWGVIRRPGDSNIAITDDESQFTTFTPDQPDLYEFELQCSDGVEISISRVSLFVPVVVVAGAGTTVTAEACAGANAAADPGEWVTVDVSLRNLGNTATTNLAATLLSGGGVLDPSGPQHYGALLAGGAPAARPFTFAVDPAAACNGTITATLDLQDGSNDLGTVAVSIPTGTPGPSVSSGAISVAIPDGGMVEVPLVVSASGTVADVNAAVRLNHPSDGELTLTLVGPTGITVDLSSGNGGIGDNYGAGAISCAGTATRFDDEAPTAVLGGAVPFAGSYRPEGSLSSFDGLSPTGTWKLRVTDGAAGNTGTVYCFTLDIGLAGGMCCAACGPSPAGSIAVTGGGSSTLSWSAPAVTGGSPIVYDVLRATTPTAAGFAAATCLATNISATSFNDAATPPAGQTWYYLVRAENACGSNLGNASNGTPHTGISCP